jgi:signal transduction histidine kinase
MERATKAGERLAELIEKLLDVSRIATGKIKLSVESFDLVDAVRDVVERFRDAATQAGCSLSIKADGPIASVWDRLRVEQILTNLVANSIKYAPGTPIEVSVAQELETAIIEVHDHGAGLSETDLSRIFERFERANTNHTGLGLGLYIARQIAEAHGGTVIARNRDNGGAVFILRLPIAPKR